MKFRTKAVVSEIEAVRYDGRNREEIDAACHGRTHTHRNSEGDVVQFDVQTSLGVFALDPGDWLILDKNGYPIRKLPPGAFMDTYEPVPPANPAPPAPPAPPKDQQSVPPPAQ